MNPLRTDCDYAGREQGDRGRIVRRPLPDEETSNGRRETVARDGMVTANHPLTAAAGMRVLARGGNAVDAAVAAAFAACVVEPARCGLGGRGYAVIRLPDGRAEVVDGHDRAPRAVSSLFSTETSPVSPQGKLGDGATPWRGHRAVAVPGIVAALYTAQMRHGRLPFAALLEDAIQLADDGFQVTATLAAIIAENHDRLASSRAAAGTFLPGGRPLEAASTLRQPDLANSLRLLAVEGADAFYLGPIAQAIESEMRRHGGLITRRDMAAYRPRLWDQPLAGTYRGYSLLTVPEAAGGVTLLEMMNLLEGFDLSESDPSGPQSLDILAQCMRIAFHDRASFVDDPAYERVPLTGLITKAYAAERRQHIHPGRAAVVVPRGEPWSHQRSNAASAPVDLAVTAQQLWEAKDKHTTHISAVDIDGTVVSLTHSIVDSFGSAVMVPDTGIFLNSGMTGFSSGSVGIRSAAAGKRPTHNGAPTIVLRPDGRPMIAIGGAGGPFIITGIAQALINIIDHKMSLQQAIGAPRVHIEQGNLLLDDRVSAETAQALRRSGYRTTTLHPRLTRPAFGRLNGISIDPTGLLRSGLDLYEDEAASALIRQPST